MKRHLPLALLLASPLALASGVAVDLKFDEDDKAAPETTLPYQWNDKWFSEVTQRSLTITEKDTFTALDNSRSATTVDQDFYRFNFIGYSSKIDGFSLGFKAGAEYIQIDQDEFGFGDQGAAVAVYEDKVEFEIVQAVAALDVNYSSAMVDAVVQFDLIPIGNLSLSQETSVRPNVSSLGKNSSSHTMDPSYGLSMDMLFKTGSAVDVGLFAEYKFLPLTYDYAVLNNTGDDFVTEEIEQDQTTTRLGIKFVLGEDTGLGRPVVGYTHETLEIDVDGNSTNESVSYLVLGLDKRF